MMKNWILGAFAGVLLFGATACEEAGSSARSGASSTIDSQLATIDAGTRIDPSDSRVVRYTQMLDVLEVRCAQTRTHIGDMATLAREKLRDDFGKRVTTHEMLEGARIATSDLRPPVDCAEIFAMLIILTGSNQ